MKGFICAALAGLAYSQTTATTLNECWDGNGGEVGGKCRDFYFNYCTEVIIYPGDTCNIYTFSDARLMWDTLDINAYYWTYYFNGDWEGD